MIINYSKIKYIKVIDKVYEVTEISFSTMYIKAVKLDLNIMYIPVHEVFDVSELMEFRIVLENKKGQAEIIRFDEWKRKQI